MLDKGRGSRVTPGAACRAVYDSNPTRLTQSRMFAGNIAIHTQWSPLQSGPSPQFHSPGLRVGKASHAVVAGLFSRMRKVPLRRSSRLAQRYCAFSLPRIRALTGSNNTPTVSDPNSEK